jgi:hypothetical protein
VRKEEGGGRGEQRGRYLLVQVLEDELRWDELAGSAGLPFSF